MTWGVLAALAVALFATAPAVTSGAALTSPITTVNAARRVVAVGDIHGAFDSLAAILREAALVDEELRWSGGDTILVQTGDFTDRGPRVRECMDLLMRLQDEAPEHGGEVRVLLANHEAMNLISALRDVAPTEFAAFVDEGSARRREDAWQTHMRVSTARARAGAYAAPVFTDEVRASWEARHPLGFVERAEAFGPDGTYGKWLRVLPVAARVEDTLFMHAGVSPGLAGSSVDDMNEQIHDEIESFDRIRGQMVSRRLITPFATIEEMMGVARDEYTRIVGEFALGGEASYREARFAEGLESLLGIASWQLLTPEGFLWFRGLALWTEAEGAAPVAAILEAQDLSHMVVAHTTQIDGVMKVRFAGGVFLIDTGMLTEHYGGRPSALEILDGRFTAIYVGGRQHLFPGGSNGPPGMHW